MITGVLALSVHDHAFQVHFFEVFNVSLCGSSLACLAGAKLFKVFNVYLCDSSLASLAEANKIHDS